MAEIDDTRTPAEEDDRIEAAVLRHLLALHPVRLSFAELLREIVADPADFSGVDAVRRAVRDLGAAGLARREGDSVLPTRAALRLDELLG